MKAVVYDQVKELLEAIPSTRSSDNQLIIEYLLIEYGTADLQKIKQLPSFESITRARRYLQSKYPEYRAPRKVREKRIDEQKGYMEFDLYGLLED